MYLPFSYSGSMVSRAFSPLLQRLFIYIFGVNFLFIICCWEYYFTLALRNEPSIINKRTHTTFKSVKISGFQEVLLEEVDVGWNALNHFKSSFQFHSLSLN